MTDISSNFSTIKHQLASLSFSHQKFEEKISQITQTRNKINNEVVNLTKDYQRKIKQLQSKLDEAFTKNQTLLKQNKLYKKDIQAFEARLIEKEKLIAMLILQQSQRFGSDARNRSELYDKGEKALKRSMQPILPKNITNKQPSHSAKQQQDKKQPKFNKQEALLSKQATHEGEYFKTDEQNVQPIISSHKNQLHEVENAKMQFHQEQQQKQKVQELKQSQKPVQLKKVLPPPPPKGKKKGLHPPIQIHEPEPQRIQEPNIQAQPKENYGQESNFNSPFDNQQEHVDATEENIFEQLSQQQQQQQQPKQEKHSRAPPPPPPQKKSKITNPPVPKKKINTSIPQPQFLQDEPAAQNFPYENFYQNEAQVKIVEEKQEVFVQNYEQPQTEEKPKISQPDNDPVESQNFEQQFKSQEPQQIQENEEHFRAPPSNKMVKPSKKKAKTAIKSINQANFYQQTSNSHQQSRQTQSNPIQTNQQAYQYEATPSSQDFFAQFGSTTTDNQHHFQSATKSHHSHILEAQESSIDYADSHSVVSSTAANMFDSQYFPEQPHVANISSQVKKMSKKKNTKREIKQLDPGSFN